MVLRVTRTRWLRRMPARFDEVFKKAWYGRQDHRVHLRHAGRRILHPPQPACPLRGDVQQRRLQFGIGETPKIDLVQGLSIGPRRAQAGFEFGPRGDALQKIPSQGFAKARDGSFVMGKKTGDMVALGRRQMRPQRQAEHLGRQIARDGRLSGVSCRS